MFFHKRLQKENILIFDGGMGTLLQEQGLQPGQSPEHFGWRKPDVIRFVHEQYRKSGAHVLTTNTFGASKYKLGNIPVEEFNALMAEQARKAAGDELLVAGSVGPSGEMIRPLGEASFSDLVSAFKAQITGLARGGADFILGETHFDLAEARAVVVAAREACSLPVGISMTFESEVSLTGTNPRIFAMTMQNMGVDLLVSNCSTGPEGFVPVLRQMTAVSDIPVLIMPNAGLPELENGRTVFKLGPEEFAQKCAMFPELGAKCVGGCCGTTPAHINALRRKMESVTYLKPNPLSRPQLCVTSRTGSAEFGPDCKPVLIGERINPTGKKELSAQLQKGKITGALELGKSQLDAGAFVLDVNVGAPMVEEESILPLLVRELSSRFDCPLCLDSGNLKAVCRGLNEFSGSILVNSISGEADKLEKWGPICAKYGAPFILLPLVGGNLPISAAERLEIIESLLRRADDLNIPRRLILVDALALTVSSKPEAALASLEVIKCCSRDLGLPTTIGLSNISFGLPARELINANFLAMALGAGLSSCIVNPNSVSIQEAFSASNVLMNKDSQAAIFIDNYGQWSRDYLYSSGTRHADPAEREHSLITAAVIKGEKDNIEKLLWDAVDSGVDPFVLVDTELVPGINLVGEKYERKEYFLPQLLLSAETMQKGFEFLRPRLEQSGRKKKGVVIMATVEGDIHDIGKNIVCLMLENHGFEVIDLGKDVPGAIIVEEAIKRKADVIGLSALMTTTMVRMEDTVELAGKMCPNVSVLVGGAVVTETYAQSIGAHGYAKDAVSAVREVFRVMQSTPKNQEKKV
ncbi:MAG: homocysteine S-methyltransferase family protein [Thermodesulfobacteriota bacterium]